MGDDRPSEEHAARFDRQAAEYDESQDNEVEYRACARLVIEYASSDPEDVTVGNNCMNEFVSAGR
jgi:hypothetical protein